MLLDGIINPAKRLKCARYDYIADMVRDGLASILKPYFSTDSLILRVLGWIPPRGKSSGE